MARGKHQQCSHAAPSPGLEIDEVQAIVGEDRYLEYAPSGGFNNQRRSLLHGMMMAFALNRTLLVAPPLSHREGPRYGSCPSHIRSPATLEKSYVQSARKANVDNFAKAKKFLKTKQGPAASMRRILSFNASVVPTVDWTTVFLNDEEDVVDAVTSLYDCSNTIWTFGEKKSCRTPDWGRRGSCKCRTIQKDLATKKPLLRVGGVFKNLDVASFEALYGRKLFQDHFLRASLEYSVPFEVLVTKLVPARGHYAALHIRGADGDFQRRIDSTLDRGFRDLAHQLQSTRGSIPYHIMPLFLATDLSVPLLRKNGVFKRGIELINQVIAPREVRVLAQADLLKRHHLKDTPTALHDAALTSWSPEEAAFLAGSPELDMHLDVLLCASARLAFSGTAGSSMSSSIRNLRKFRISASARSGRSTIVNY